MKLGYSSLVTDLFTKVAEILNLSAPGAEKLLKPLALSDSVESSSAVMIDSTISRPTL